MSPEKVKVFHQGGSTVSRVSGRTVLASACVLAIAVPAVAVGAGEGRPFILGERNPSGSRELTRESEVIARTGTYGTRQSNKKDGDGGGAIYGCRSNPGSEPCIRANNLKGGRAFEFETIGREGGRIETGDPAGAPFTTNATGVATGLNADAIDGRDGASLAAAGDFKFARVNAAGTAFEDNIQRGAVGVAYRPGINAYDVSFDRDVTRCSASVNPIGGDNAGKPNASVFPIGGAAANTFRVDFPDNAGPTRFYIQVIC